MSNLPSNMVGWDIGGAHLKAVLLDANGHVIHCILLSCTLWKGLDFLQRAIIDAQAQLNQEAALQGFKIELSGACHAITMTGELVDLFENRHQGVCEIAKVAANILGEKTLFYAANIGFVPLKCVSEFSANIASSNWHASVSALAMHVTDALFVDIGSTTTDIIAIDGGKVVSEGLSDAYRLAADSLVYTGVVRTPVMALAQKLWFANEDGEESEINVAAEHFATMADVYRLTAELDARADFAETADGKGKTQLESARRLARMIGHDVDKSGTAESLEKWIKLAFNCRDLHMQQIKTAMLKQLKPNMTIIGAGVGSFLIKAIAANLGYSFIYGSEQATIRSAKLSNRNIKYDIDVCFPAYAVAFLAQKYHPC